VQKWKIKEKYTPSRDMVGNGNNRKNKGFWRRWSHKGGEEGRKRWEIMEMLIILLKYKVVFFSKPLDY